MDQGDKPNVIFSWTAHPAKQHPRKGCIALGVIAFAGLGVAMTAGHPAWGVLGSILLVVSLQRFFFPSTFEIDETGITAKYLMTNKRMKWRDVRRFVKDERGGYLSTRSRKSWLDAYQGLQVVWGEEAEEAIAAVNAQLQLQLQRHEGTEARRHEGEETERRRDEETKCADRPDVARSAAGPFRRDPESAEASALPSHSPQPKAHSRPAGASA